MNDPKKEEAPKEPEVQDPVKPEEPVVRRRGIRSEDGEDFVPGRGRGRE